MATVRVSRGIAVLLLTYEERIDKPLRTRLLRAVADRLAANTA